MLDILLDSCTHLELDTYGKDYRRKNQKVHVCDAIRRVLPRLQHVRIRLGAMCPAMLGHGQIPVHWEANQHGNSRKNTFIPVSLPKLKSLVMICGTFHGRQMQLCGDTDYDRSDHGVLPNAQKLARRPIT